jgi:hypothetical protein
MALAQHYGLPTRLLDWTSNAYVAAYFAASGAVRTSAHNNSNLCVWALLRMIVEFEGSKAMGDDLSRLPVKLITAPAADNPNLRAQQGLFLGYQQRDIYLNEQFISGSYDQLVAENLTFFPTSTPFLFRLTLPTSEAPELLRILSAHGINGSTVFPGLEGSVRAVLERQNWPDVDQWSLEGAAAQTNERMQAARDRMLGGN